MTKNDHFETQKCHFWAFLDSFKISLSSLQHPKHNMTIAWLSIFNHPLRTSFILYYESWITHAMNTFISIVVSLISDCWESLYFGVYKLLWTMVKGHYVVYSGVIVPNLALLFPQEELAIVSPWLSDRCLTATHGTHARCKYIRENIVTKSRPNIWP